MLLRYPVAARKVWFVELWPLPNALTTSLCLFAGAEASPGDAAA